MKQFLFLVLSCLFLCLAAQAQCNMPGYSRQMAKADSCIKASNYKMAQEHYNAAKLFCDTKSDEVEVAKDNLFAIIDGLRQTADQALQKAQKLTDAFYFYDDKFALAYGELELNHVFYFIDKNGDSIEKLGVWTKAEQFDVMGFAKVENWYCPKCLLDTLGNTYPVAYDIKDLSPDITALDLNGQELTTLPEQVCQNTQLKVLLLNNNQLSTLPQSIGQLSNLQTLGLSYNQLSTLPQSIGQLSKCKQLDLRSNQLNTLPESIGQLSKCEYLDLSDNKLSSLPQSIGQLGNLKTLNLGMIMLVGISLLEGGDNQLSTLPESIGQLSKCEQLDLRGNKLSSLPESIGQLSKCKRLYLGGNQLSTLPQSIGQLSKCEQLDLSFNQLSILPQSIGNLSKLQTLNLSGNRLNTLPQSIGQLSKCQYLYLVGNDALAPYNNYLENEELKAFLTKLSKGEVHFGQ